MGLSDKIKNQQESQEQQKRRLAAENLQKAKHSSGLVDFTIKEIEFLLKLIGETEFKGKEVMTLYDIIAKIQNAYLVKKGKA